MRDAGAHGIRRCYQAGCRCAPCQAANTAYTRQYRERQRAGRPVLGAHVAGREAVRIVATLEAEGLTRSDIARGLGHQPDRSWPELAIARDGAAVTWRTLYRLRRLLRHLDRMDA